jgi:acetyl-CoA carboxylase carboxyl transferase subunit alpha
MAIATFDFEKPIVELENKIEELEKSPTASTGDVQDEISKLKAELMKLKNEIYSNLTPWQRVQIARHINRPHSLDYINVFIDGFVELHGDRSFGDDPAVVAGIGNFNGQPVAIISQQKGKDTKENLARNFGMSHPEGYRKALRIMKMADKFNIPIIILIDTPGAYPGIGAEERGQAEAIAKNIKEMSTLRVPILIVIIGEGASGGALGIGIGDTILMLENAWYCVISPEGCASILYRDKNLAPKAAEALKLSAPDLMELKVIDEIVKEPLGGAHKDPEKAFEYVKEAIERNLKKLMNTDTETLMKNRYEKYRKMGEFEIL